METTFSGYIITDGEGYVLSDGDAHEVRPTYEDAIAFLRALENELDTSFPTAQVYGLTRVRGKR